MNPNEKKKRAAVVIATSGNASEAARQAEVNRSTVTRWLRDPEFRALITEAEEDDPEVSARAEKSLSDLLPQAVSVIERALSGDKTMVASARVALDVMKVAAQLAPKGQSGNEAPPLADLIAELDKRDKANS